MAETYALAAESRSTQGRKAAKSIRQNKQIPAVIYGHGLESKPLVIKSLEFARLFAKAGESSLVDLTIDGGEAVKVLIHSIQRDPLKDVVTHVDFYQVRMDEKLKAEVELIFMGEAAAVADLGGTLIKNRDHIEVQCLPKDLPHDIKIDISSLATFEDTIRIKDIGLPEGVEALAEDDAVIAAVAAPRTEEELAALEEDVVEDVDSVEVDGSEAAEQDQASDGDDKPAEGDKKDNTKEGE